MSCCLLAKWPGLSLQKGRPGRRTNLALCGDWQRYFHPPVDRGQHQHTTACRASRVGYHGAIGGNSRRLVQIALGENFYRTAGQILGRYTEHRVAVLTMDHHQGFLIRGQFRVGVVVTDKGHALNRTATDVGFVDLWLAGTVGGEVDGLPILTPERFGIDAKVIGDPAHLARTQIHHVDFRVAILGQHERQAIAFRRPGWRTVQTFKIGQLLAATGVYVLNKDARTLLLERHISDALAIWSKGWRQNRLARLQQGYAARAVIVSALQGGTGAVHGEAFGGDKQPTG